MYHIAGYFPYRCKFSPISRMGSLLRKIYSGLLHEVRLWVIISEIGTDTICPDGLLTFKPKAMGCKALQSTIAAEET